LTVSAEAHYPLTDENDTNNGAHIAFIMTIQVDESAVHDLNVADEHVIQAMETAQTMGSCNASLGKALKSLEQIMNIVGGIAEASHNLAGS
jgi:hypothetical protein